MTQLYDRLKIRKLSVVERIKLVDEIWDSIAEEQAQVEITEAQREEIDRRLLSYREGRERGIPWEVVKGEGPEWTMTQSISFLRTAEYRIPE